MQNILNLIIVLFGFFFGGCVTTTVQLPADTDQKSKSDNLPDDGTIPEGHPILGVWQSRANPGAQRRPYRVEVLPDGRVMGNKQRYVDRNGTWTAKGVIKEKGMWIDNPKDEISESRISELTDENSVKWGRYWRFVMPNGLLKGGSTHSAVMRKVVNGKPTMRTKPAPYLEGLPSKAVKAAWPRIVGIPRGHAILGMWKLLKTDYDMTHKLEFLCDGHVVRSQESAVDFSAGADEVIEIVDPKTVRVSYNRGRTDTFSVSSDGFLLNSKGEKIGTRYAWPK
jgi:hypothetical protein